MLAAYMNIILSNDNVLKVTIQNKIDDPSKPDPCTISQLTENGLENGLNPTNLKTI